MAKAIDTSVVTKEKQRIERNSTELADDKILDDFNKIKSGKAARMSQKN